jgi:hypothetical protein
MDLTIKSIPMKRIYRSDPLLKQLKRLNLLSSRESWDSYMSDCMERGVLGTAIVVLKDERIIAWGWLMDKDSTNELKIAIFVEPYYRRYGIGSKIAKRAKLIGKRRKKEIICYPWNAVSEKFFDSQNGISPCNRYFAI